MSLVTRILRENHNFAVVGATPDREKYGHELLETLQSKGYRVYPINPKYELIDDHVCYPSLHALPERPEVVVTAVPPSITEIVVQTCGELGIKTVWMVPGAWSEHAVEVCESHGIEEVHDICLVLALRSFLGSTNGS